MGEESKNWHKFVILGVVIIVLVSSSYFALLQIDSNGFHKEQKLEHTEQVAATAGGENHHEVNSFPSSLPGTVASSTVSKGSYSTKKDASTTAPPVELFIENSPASQQQQQPLPGAQRPDAPAAQTPVVPVSAVPVSQVPSGAPIPQNEIFAANNEAWQQFKAKYNKLYSSKGEELKRLAIFNENLKFISEFNIRQTNLFTLGVNKFADMTRDEINRFYFAPSNQWSSMPASPPSFILKEESGAPKEVDWRHLMQGPVDQGQRQDNAIYAAVASIEGAFNRKFQAETPIKLSELQVIDCMCPRSGATQPTCPSNYSMVDVFDLLQRNSYSLTKPEIYRMHTYNGAHCQISQETTSSSDLQTARLAGYMTINPSNILEALFNSGPLCVAIDASQSTFHFYQSGLYHDENCSTETYNHHATLVGYSSTTNGDPSKPHYLLRNSFGTQWGESGYMRLLKDEQRNKCLPQKMAIYPSIAG